MKTIKQFQLASHSNEQQLRHNLPNPRGCSDVASTAAGVVSSSFTSTSLSFVPSFALLSLAESADLSSSGVSEICYKVSLTQFIHGERFISDV